MWMLDNRTPFEVERTWVRDKDGSHHWIVVVKATFDISVNGTLSISEKCLVPLHTAEFQGEDGKSSLRYEADLVAMKPGTDIYLNSTAYAPRGKQCKKVLVSFQIGGIRKELLVSGERIWCETSTGGIAPSSPKLFKSMPIIYERAFGGFDQDDLNPQKHRIDLFNPVGTGNAVNPHRLLGKPAPNIENTTRTSPKNRPAGFGAIASFWSPRRELTGTYDENWEAQRKPLLPLDFDSRSMLCAPADQQVAGYLNGGEQVVLTNLTPSGSLKFKLPKVHHTFETYFGSIRKNHVAKLVSVIIESDQPRLILSWQTSLNCGNDADYLDKTVIKYTEDNR